MSLTQKTRRSKGRKLSTVQDQETEENPLDLLSPPELQNQAQEESMPQVSLQEAAMEEDPEEPAKTITPTNSSTGKMVEQDGVKLREPVTLDFPNYSVMKVV